MNTTKVLPEIIEEKLNKHLEVDYPDVVNRLHNIEKLLHEISGGMKVLRWIGWLVTALGGLIVFLQEHLFHLGK